MRIHSIDEGKQAETEDWSQPPSPRSLASYKIKWITLHTKWSEPSDQWAVYLTFLSSQHLLLDSLGCLQAIWQGKHPVLHSFTHCCVLLKEAQHLCCPINLFFKTYSLVFRVVKEAEIHPRERWVNARQAVETRAPFQRTMFAVVFLPTMSELADRPLLKVFSSFLLIEGQ